jgi:hypothetical protein
MTLMFLWLGLAFATQVWLCLRVGRSNVALAILTFFIGFPGAAYSLFTQRGDEQTSVTRPFLANLVFSVLFLFSGWGVLQQMLAAQDAQMQAEAGAPFAAPPVARPVIVPLPPEPAASPASAVAASAADAPASAPVASANPVEAFSSALHQAGVAHTVTRLPASSALPAGVAEAVQVAATPKAAPAGRAPSEYAVTLFRCETVAACRGIAGAYLQETGAAKRRVLQNATLLLALPQGETDESDMTPAAMASAFRRLDVRP